MARAKFVRPAEARFRATLHSRVDAYFLENNLSKHGDWRMLVKTVLYLGGYLGTFAWLMLQPHSALAYLGGMALMGIWTSGIGFNLGHDGAHGGYSERPWVNQLVAHSFTLIGAHVYTWKIIHNVIHHTFTNIPGADGDLNTVPALRYHDTGAPRRPYHRFQHLYCFGLYCLATLVWVFSKDFVHMRKKEHCGYVKPVPPRVEWGFLILAKGSHYAAFLLVPWLVLGLPLGLVVGAFLAMHAVAGLTLATVFAVGHLVDDVRIIETDETGIVRDEWASHQLRTTANFSTRSRFFYWTVGGLNFQIEHHLFPTICHVHYRELAPIVEQTAREFGLPYTSYSSFPKAIGAHMHYLRELGRPLPNAAAQPQPA